MSLVNNVATLPLELRKWVDQQLYERGFSGYEQLAREITELGHPISKSSLNRYGVKLKERLLAGEVNTLTTQNKAAFRRGIDA